MAHSRNITLGDVADLVRGVSYRPTDLLPGGSGAIPLLRATNIGSRALDLAQVLYVPPALVRESQLLRRFDVVIAMSSGSREAVGRLAQLRRDWAGCVGAFCAAIRPDPELVDPEYLGYVLQSSEFRERIESHAVGTAIMNLSRDRLFGFSLQLPTSEDQRAIAHILGTLDDKIDLNRRMSETLEAMARALFESWFDNLDVDRVRVEELATAGVLEIGDGYRAKNSELGDSGLPFIRAGNLDNGFDTEGAETLRSDSVVRARNKVSRPGDIAFTSKGTVGRFARVHEYIPAFVYSPQVCFWRSLMPDLLEPSVLFLWMKSTDLRRQIEEVAGQTDMAPYVSLRDQRAMEVPSFPASQHRVARSLEPLLARQAHLTKESMCLARLRDSLLPKLVSGAWRVRTGSPAEGAAEVLSSRRHAP